jgi:integrase
MYKNRKIWYDGHMSTLPSEEREIIPAEDGRFIPARPLTPMTEAGQVANRIAGQTIFQRYLDEKAANTVKRQARDLELFAEYLLDIGILPDHGANFQTDPDAWQGVTWGLVEGFVQWLLHEGYAIASVNARLSTVRTYARLAIKAGSLDRQEGLLIQSVKSFSRQSGHNVDERRDQTRIEEVTYAYKPPGRQRRRVVTRQSTKKKRPTRIEDETADLLKQVANHSPQAWRDALLACLLLDHGLRASELAILTVSNFNLNAGEMTFYRPKVKGSDHEWTTHKLTNATRTVASYYIGALYPPTLLPDGRLILATSRLLKSGEGGQLLPKPLNRVRISERMAWLGKQLDIPKLSAHDCRHYCATKMAHLGYGVDELMAWFGWTSAQTAMRYVAMADVTARYKG